MSKNLAGMTEAELVEESALYSTKSPVICLLLSLIHCHYFYAGRIGRGILCLLTANFLYIGFIIDFIIILCGKFKDSEGLYISPRGQAIHLALGNITIAEDSKPTTDNQNSTTSTEEKKFPKTLYRNGVEYSLFQICGSRATYERTEYGHAGEYIDVADYEIRDTDWAVLD